MKNFKKNCLLALLMLSFSTIVFAADERDYAWIYLQDGIKHFENKEYGDAMDCFSQYRTLKPQCGVVAFWIGQVYEIERDYDLAILEYQKSLKYMNYESTRYMNEIIQTSLHLADIYHLKHDDQNFFNTLTNLLKMGNLPSKELVLNQYKTLSNSLSSGGVNKMMELHRMEGTFEPLIYERLANYFLEKSDYDKAEKFLLLTVVTHLSTFLQEVKNIEPFFIFTNEINANQATTKGDYYSEVNAVINHFSRNFELQQFVSQSSLMELLYKLGFVYHQLDKDLLAVDFLWICIQYPYDERWSANANSLFLEISAAQ